MVVVGMNARHERAKGWATSKFCEEVKKGGRRRARRRRLASSDGIERIASRFEQEFVDKFRLNIISYEPYYTSPYNFLKSIHIVFIKNSINFILISNYLYLQSYDIPRFETYHIYSLFHWIYEYAFTGKM